MAELTATAQAPLSRSVALLLPSAKRGETARDIPIDASARHLEIAQEACGIEIVLQGAEELRGLLALLVDRGVVPVEGLCLLERPGWALANDQREVKNSSV